VDATSYESNGCHGRKKKEEKIVSLEGEEDRKKKWGKVKGLFEVGSARRYGLDACGRGGESIRSCRKKRG